MTRRNEKTRTTLLGELAMDAFEPQIIRPNIYAGADLKLVRAAVQHESEQAMRLAQSLSLRAPA